MGSFRLPATALALLQMAGVEAFWRMNCGIIQRGRIDPLVNPDALAAHSHSIVGGSNIGIHAKYEDLFNSECTSCEIGQDKSAYWTPTMYYQYANGSFYEVDHDGAVAYYLGRGPNVAQTQIFPPNLNILSGDKSLRSYDNKTYTWGNAQYPGRPVADRVSFNCIDDKIEERNYMFRTNCKNGLRAQIHFQSCWDGENLYKADNSHVAYQSAIDNGICPPTHPVQIPHLFIETLYKVNDVPGRNDADWPSGAAYPDGGRFVFSQGDTTGYGFHGDFQNGWDLDVLQNATTDCLATDNFGQISACPALQASQTTGYRENCPERDPQINETTRGLISRLPGCITVTEGPEPAPGSSMNCAANDPRGSPTVYNTPMSTPTPTLFPNPGDVYPSNSQQIYVGCYNDTAGGYRALNAISTSNYENMTIAYCQQYCNDRGYRLSGVEYSQECHCDNAILSTAYTPQDIAGATQCNWVCGGTRSRGGTQEICGGYGMISIYNNTSPTFNAFGDAKNSAGNIKPPQALAPFPPNYVGCATDTGGSRTLKSASTTNLGMTVEKCATYCSPGGGAGSVYGFQYYGLEYSSECYCGNTLSSPGFITSPTSSPSNTTCNMRCGGDGSELCGGPNALSVYINTAYTPLGTKPNVGKFVTKGCLSDPNGAAARAIWDEGSGQQVRFMGTTSGVDADSCVKFCLGKYMNYAGIEAGSECYCGTVINPTSGGVLNQTCDTAQLKVCAGDETEYCGGAKFMSLYYSATL